MEGTLRGLRDDFGFLHSDDGERAFAPRDNLPADARNGLRYRYDTEDQGGRNPVAVNIQAAGGTPRGHERQRDRPERDTYQKITVLIHPEEDGEIHDFPEGQFRVVSVTLAAKRGNGPATGLTVKFFVDSDPIDTEFTTTGSGHVYFNASLPPNAKRAMIIAVVKDGNRDVGVFSQEWKKKEEPDMTCQVIKVTRLPTTTDGFTTFRVLTLTGDEKKGVDHEVVAESPLDLEIRWKGKDHVGSILTENGHTLVEVRTKDSKRGTTFFFRSVTSPLVFSEPQTVEVWEPKAKLPSNLDVKDYNAAKGKTLVIVTTQDTKLIGSKVIIESIAGAELEANEIGSGNLKTGQKLEFDSTGSISVALRIKNLQSGQYGGDQILVKVEGTRLAHEPIYIAA